MKRMKPHWHASSEKYTGADSLLTAIHAGWSLKRLMYSEEFQRRGGSITVY